MDRWTSGGLRNCNPRFEHLVARARSARLMVMPFDTQKGQFSSEIEARLPDCGVARRLCGHTPQHNDLYPPLGDLYPPPGIDVLT